MSGNGASEGEMSSHTNAFAEAVRTEFVRPLDSRLEADLVRLVAAEARAASPGRTPARPRRAPARRLPLPARIAFATGAILVGTAGLAVAGVKLPGPVDSVFEKAGVDLPNQAADHKAPAPARPTSEPAGQGDATSPGSDNGKHKAKGHRKDKARGRAEGHDKQPGVPNGNAYGQGGGAPGNSENAPGQTKSSGGSSSDGKAKGHSTPVKPPPGSRGKGHSD